MSPDPHPNSDPVIARTLKEVEAAMHTELEAMLGQRSDAATLRQFERATEATIAGRGLEDVEAEARHVWTCTFPLEPNDPEMEAAGIVLPRRECSWEVERTPWTRLKLAIFGNAGRCPLHGTKLQEKVAIEARGRIPTPIFTATINFGAEELG